MIVKKLRDEGGNVLVLSALSLTVIVGMIGLAVDVGMLYRAQRQVQKIADAGALAAAANMGTDGTGLTAAKQAATQDGFTIGTAAGDVSVPTPTIQSASSSTGYVQVMVTEHTPMIFMPILGSKFDTVDISGVAGASYTISGNNACMLALSPTGAVVPNESGAETDGSTTMVWSTTVMSGIAVEGSSKINDPNCGVQACGPATEVAGSGKTAAGIYAAGSANIVASSNTAPSWGTDNSGSTITTKPTLAPCSGDPLASSMPAAPSPGSCIDPSWMVNHNAGGAAETIGPGTYCNFNTENVSTLTMNPGLYIMKTTFSTNSGTTIQGTGVTMFLANGVIADSSNYTYVSGGATPYGVANGTTMDITAPTSGTYSGIAVWDGNSSSSTPDTFTFGGGASSTFSGTIYAPNTNLVLGNGSQSTTMSSNVIASTILVEGGSTVTDNYKPAGSGSKPTGGGVTLAQ